MESTGRKKKTADAKPGPEAEPDIKPGDTDGDIVPGRRETPKTCRRRRAMVSGAK